LPRLLTVCLQRLCFGCRHAWGGTAAVAFGVPAASHYHNFAFSKLFRKNATLMGSVFPRSHEDFPFAVEMIAQGRCNVAPLFNTPPFSLAEAPDAFHKCIHCKTEVMKVNIQLSQSTAEDAAKARYVHCFGEN
jgi:threonine dehydrogenase-like Zn-dependent dehydrogenase